MKKGLVLGMAALMAVSAALTGCGSNSGNGGSKPVSYTHLDVYKRQVYRCACSGSTDIYY